METNKYRTIFISDLHIGSTQCQSKVLLNFLQHNNSDTLYLVGDIIDFWSLSRRMRWTVEHNTIIQKILKKARHGTEVIYVPGNHDENVREYDGYVFGDITIKNKDIFVSATGKRYIVIHGDEMDSITMNHKWIAKLGGDGYDALIWLNPYINNIRKLLGYRPHFSLSQFIKYKVKNIVQFISNYEQIVVNSISQQNADGVICGHIHHPEIKEIDGYTYMNTGDFVESCSALVEHYDGRFEIVYWNIPTVDE